MTQSDIDNLLQAKQHLELARKHLDKVWLPIEDGKAISYSDYAAWCTDSALVYIEMVFNTFYGKHD